MTKSLVFNAILSFTFLFLSYSTSAQDNQLSTYSKDELVTDFDLAVNSLKEAHTGLHWYLTKPEFDSICLTQRNRIVEGMNSYEFYRLISYVLTAIKEGHCSVNPSKDISAFFKEGAKFLPIYLKFLGKKCFVLHDLQERSTKGWRLIGIDGIPIEEILHQMFQHTSSLADGYSETGKFKSMDFSSFAHYYTDFFPQRDSFLLEMQHPDHQIGIELKVAAISLSAHRTLGKDIPRHRSHLPAELMMPETSKTAILKFNTSFSDRRFEKMNTTFTRFVDSVFQLIKMHHPSELIIDIRNVTGGYEGAEDYILSYLNDKVYQKYNYVQAPAFTFSFLEHIRRNTPGKWDSFAEMLTSEHYLAKDGRILRKADVLAPPPPKDYQFKGQIYVLTSGKTYSGGSELAALLRNYTNAIFVGEETGGGYYGQTSGSYLHLILPNTKMRIRLPILKFSLNVKKDDIPFGRGLIPDYQVIPTFDQFINGKDAELDFTLELISNQ